MPLVEGIRQHGTACPSGSQWTGGSEESQEGALADHEAGVNHSSSQFPSSIRKAEGGERVVGSIGSGKRAATQPSSGMSVL